MEDAVPNSMARERRLTMYLMADWQDLRGNRRCPVARDFAASIPPEVLPYCFIVLPAGVLDDSRLCNIGEYLARMSELTTTSLALSEVPGETLLGVATRLLRTALERATPTLEKGEFEDRQGKWNVYRAILLPLEDGHGVIVQIFGGARCEAREDNMQV